MSLTIILIGSVFGLAVGVAAFVAPVWKGWRKWQADVSTGATDAETSYDESWAA